MAKEHTLGSGPVQQEYQQMLRAVMKTIDEFCNPPGQPKKHGIVIMMFPFGEGEGHRTNYMSNCKREDIITLFKEQLAYFEGMPDDQSGRA